MTVELLITSPVCSESDLVKFVTKQNKNKQKVNEQ